MTARSTALLATLTLALATATPGLAGGQKMTGKLAVSILEVSARSPEGRSAPFEVNRHPSARNKPAILVSGTLEVRWSNSIFAAFAPLLGVVNQSISLEVQGGEDDTTRNPVGVVSQLWSDLYPEANDEGSLAVQRVRLDLPGSGKTSTARFSLTFTHGDLAANDDTRDLELVIHVPGSGENPEEISGVQIFRKDAKHFLESMDIDVIDRDVSSPGSRQQATPGYDGLR